MRAIVFDGEGGVSLRSDMPTSALEPHQIRIHTRVSGISAGTETRNMMGPIGGRPLIPGYQNVGIVSERGSAVTSLTVGQRVYTHHWNGGVLPDHPLIGMVRLGSGAHSAERVGAADSADLLTLPEWISDDDAAFLSVSAIGLHNARRGRVGPGKRVLITGLGPVGLHAVQGARLEGGEVFGLDRLPARLRWGKQFGCQYVFNANDADVWDQISAHAPFDVVIETTGVNALLDPILRIIAGERSPAREMLRQGTIVMVGLRDQTQYTFSLAHPKEVVLQHTSHHTRTDLKDVIVALKEGKWSIASLITHRILPEEAPDFYRRLAAGSNEVLGVLINWDNQEHPAKRPDSQNSEEIN